MNTLQLPSSLFRYASAILFYLFYKKFITPRGYKYK